MGAQRRRRRRKKSYVEGRRRVVGINSRVVLDENCVNQMNYLKCVVKETLRLHSPVPLLVARETSSSVKLRGYDIPAKTMVFINAWAIQRDPELWDDSEEFIPERFETSQVDLNGQDFQLIPFGIGRRGCPAMSFGLASTEYVLANLLYWFNWNMSESLFFVGLDVLYFYALKKKTSNFFCSIGLQCPPFYIL